MNQQFNDDHPWTLAKEIRSKTSTNYSELATKLYIFYLFFIVELIFGNLYEYVLFFFNHFFLHVKFIISYSSTDSQQVLKILHCSSESSLCTPLDSVFSSTIHPDQLTCNSDRLFTKLSKQQESTFLKL